MTAITLEAINEPNKTYIAAMEYWSSNLSNPLEPSPSETNYDIEAPKSP